MRISIGEPRRRPHARPKHHRRRNRPHTYRAAVALPAIPLARSQPAQSTSARRARVEATLPERRAPTEAPWTALGVWARQWLETRWRWLVVVLVLAAAIVFAATDSRFFVYGAEIHGANHLKPEAIYAAAGIDTQSIFWVNPQLVAQRLVQMDGIQAVRVRCRLPARVIIDVEEREPIVLWRALSQGRDWWVDSEGVVLPYHGDPNSDDTLFVVDSSERQLGVGVHIEPEGIVQSVMQLADALPGTRIFYYGADRGLSFTQQAAGAQWPVYVGTSDDLGHKIQAVAVLTDYLNANGIQPSFLDVRWAGWPAYGRPSSPAGEGGN